MGKKKTTKQADKDDNDSKNIIATGFTREEEQVVDIDLLRKEPYISEFYNETYLYLVPKDPKSLFVFWEIGEDTRLELVGRFGDDFFQNNALILKINQVTNVEFDGFNANYGFEVDDSLHWKNNYWIAVDGGQNYVAEIGYRANGTDFFEKVARSNVIFIPKGKVEDKENYCEWNNVDVKYENIEIPVDNEDWRFNQFNYWKNGTHGNKEEVGYWSLVLHQHLPFIRHPEYDVSLEEQWFFEAVVSVYTQTLKMFHNLENDKVDFRLTLSITPPLISMMQDPLLIKRAARHIDECIKFATRERDNGYGKPYYEAIEQTLHKFWIAKEIFDKYEGDLTRGYKYFQDLGKIEIITCPATHMVLPFFAHLPEAIRAQIKTAVTQYERTFGKPPQGMWLPENAYTPGIDRYLADEGIKWFLVNRNGLFEGDTKCFYDTNAPIVTDSGIACFGIDKDTRDQVWSRESGYPGHPNYKEWYRDLGYDADWDYLPEYFKTADVRRNTGLKYYRITDKMCSLHEKDYYDVAWAKETVYEQAGQFVYYRGVQANHIKDTMSIKPCIVSAYDAELFGHWWEEGHQWLESVFRKMCFDQEEVRPCTPSEYLAENPNHQRLTPGASSWGKNDYFNVWVDGREYQPNCWVYRHYFRLIEKMIEVANKYQHNKDPLLERALNQAVRELFLSTASDWGFLIETGQATRYSEMQIVTHIARTKELLEQIQSGKIEEKFLITLETADCIFPYQDTDFRVFCSNL